MNKIYVITLLTLTMVLGLNAQDCTSPFQVCYNNPVTEVSNESAVAGSNVFCFDADNSVYFSVTSNDVGGQIDITIDGFSCTDTNSSGQALVQEMEAVLFSIDESFPCLESAYTPLDCSIVPSASQINLSTTAAPSTTYYVMVDGANDAMNILEPGECSFDIDASGPGIENNFTAGPDFEIELGDNVTIQASGFGTNFSWNPPTGLDDINSGNPTATPAFNTEYILNAFIDGCNVSDTMTISITPFVDPLNAFTPNGDGSYDTWNIPNIFRFPKADIKVYSRWGQIVFRSIGYNQPWDGTLNGGLLPVATYYYIIELNNETLSDEDRVLAGSVAIIY